MMRFVLLLNKLPALTNTIRSRSLSFLTSGKIITGLSRPAFGPSWRLATEDWPAQTILENESDLRPLNLGLSTANTCRGVHKDRSAWRLLVTTATMMYSFKNVIDSDGGNVGGQRAMTPALFKSSLPLSQSVPKSKIWLQQWLAVGEK